MVLKRCALSLLALLLFFFLMIPIAASAASSEQIRQEINDLEQEQKSIQEQIDELEKALTQNRQELSGLVEEKINLDQQVSLLSSQLLNLEQQLQGLKLLVADRETEYGNALQAYETLNQQCKERIRAMEEGGTISYWSVLFRSSSFSDFLDRLEMIREIAEADQARMTELSAAAEAVLEAQESLLTEKASLEENLAHQQQKKAELDSKKAQIEELMRQLAAKGQEFEDLLDQSEQEQQALMEQIAQLEDEFDKAAYEEWLAAQPPVEKPPQITESVTDGITWVVPVPYYILSSPFGMRLHPIHGDYRMHNGIDMACAEGTPIYATRSGLVEIAQWSDSAGNYVQLNHGDSYRSVYMHMTHFIVSAGSYVQAGQVIGYVGNTGASRGNHLHFGVSYNGVYTNPYPLISH